MHEIFKQVKGCFKHGVSKNFRNSIINFPNKNNYKLGKLFEISYKNISRKYGREEEHRFEVRGKKVPT